MQKASTVTFLIFAVYLPLFRRCIKRWFKLPIYPSIVLCALSGDTNRL